MPFSEEIKRYDVSYYAGGANANNYEYRAIIGLRRSDYSLIGAAYFHRDPATMPATDHQDASGYVYCHYLAEDFPRVLDLLRNEKPVYVRYVGGGWHIGDIETMATVGWGHARAGASAMVSRSAARRPAPQGVPDATGRVSGRRRGKR